MKVIRWFLIIPVAILEIVAAILEIITTTISGILAIFRVWLLREYDYRRWLKRDLADCESILELGCGSNSPLLQIGYGCKTVAIDIFDPYVRKHVRQGNYRACTRADILKMPFPDNAFDAVVMCDVLEHLPRRKVMEIDLFEQMEKCAIKKLIIFTPNGFVENDEVDGDPYQRHVSAWEPEDYKQKGYMVRGATGLRHLFGKASLPKYHPYSVTAIVGMITQPFVYGRPQLAWHSYAVKEIR